MSTLEIIGIGISTLGLVLSLEMIVRNQLKNSTSYAVAELLFVSILQALGFYLSPFGYMKSTWWIGFLSAPLILSLNAALLWIRGKISRKKNSIIITESNGISLQGPAQNYPLLWKEIVEIKAFKKDEITTDLLCLEIIDLHNRSCIFHEDMAGFEELVTSIERELPLSLKDWKELVLQPPFKENLIIIFKKSL